MKTIWQSGLTRYIKNHMPEPNYQNFRLYLNSEEYSLFKKEITKKYWLWLTDIFEIRNQNYKFGATIYRTTLLYEIGRVRMVHF